MPIYEKTKPLSYLTMSIATETLQKYIDAENAILSGQEVRFEGRLLRRADLSIVQAGRREWERKVNIENRQAAGGSSFGYKTATFL